MPSGIPGWTAEEERFLDRLDRVTWRVARVLALGVPIWFLLLLVVPYATPLGPMPSLAVATLGAAAACWAVERRVARDRRPPSGEPPAPTEEARGRRRHGMRTLVVAGAVVLLAIYAFLVIVVGGGQ